MKEKLNPEEVINKINSKTKPLGALGVLEDTAFKICTILNTLEPELKRPAIVVYAADHGAAKNKGISLYPQEVTYQMVCNFLSGGAAINVLSRLNGLEMKIVDAGIKHDFEYDSGLINMKIGQGTKDYLKEPAMSVDECLFAIERSREYTGKLYEDGCNIIGCGEMGIGNTASASMLMSVFLGLPVEECTGRGTGLDDEGVRKKTEILSRVIKLHNPDKNDPVGTLAKIGGFEIAMMTGTFLEARKRNMIIMVDGFIATAALLTAYHINNSVLDNCIFCHQSDEYGHKKMLEYFSARPLLSLGMRLGEATGCAAAFPLIKASAAIVNEMASFQSAGVSSI